MRLDLWRHWRPAFPGGVVGIFVGKGSDETAEHLQPLSCPVAEFPLGGQLIEPLGAQPLEAFVALGE